MATVNINVHAANAGAQQVPAHHTQLPSIFTDLPSDAGDTEMSALTPVPMSPILGQHMLETITGQPTNTQVTVKDEDLIDYE